MQCTHCVSARPRQYGSGLWNQATCNTYTHVCTYIYIYTYTHIYTYIYIYTHLHEYIYIYIHICIYIITKRQRGREREIHGSVMDFLFFPRAAQALKACWNCYNVYRVYVVYNESNVYIVCSVNNVYSVSNVYSVCNVYIASVHAPGITGQAFGISPHAIHTHT